MTEEKRAQMGKALLKFKAQHGHPAMRALLEDVAGTPAISQVPADRIAAVLAACALPPKPTAPQNISDLTARAFAKWNMPKPKTESQS